MAKLLQQFALKRLYDRVKSWFTEDEIRRVVGLGDSTVERIAIDWFAKDGKRWRPFLAVAMFNAVADIDEHEDLVKTIAFAMEGIHKASLIYDDIQDRDDQRYGEATVHSVHGVPVALTASLLLIGQGYRMLADCSADAEVRAEMLALATKGHCDLCLGQGAELVWMNEKRPLTPEEVLDFFKWKTAPSFDVVFRLPCIAAGLDAATLAQLQDYSLIIGTAYQIADDLDDYHGRGDVDDLVMGRPDIVVAYAYRDAAPEDQAIIHQAWCGDPAAADIARVKELLFSLGEPRARETLTELRQRANATLDDIGNRGLVTLLQRINEMLFDKR